MLRTGVTVPPLARRAHLLRRRNTNTLFFTILLEKQKKVTKLEPEGVKHRGPR